MFELCPVMSIMLPVLLLSVFFSHFSLLSNKDNSNNLTFQSLTKDFRLRTKLQSNVICCCTQTAMLLTKTLHFVSLL